MEHRAYRPSPPPLELRARLQVIRRRRRLRTLRTVAVDGAWAIGLTFLGGVVLIELVAR